MWKNKKLTKIKIFGSVILITGACFFYITKTNAQEIVATKKNQGYLVNLNKQTIEKGFTVTAFNLKLSLVPGILSSSTDVEIIELHEEMELPWQVNRIGKIYQFEFKNKAAYDNHKPFYIQLNYDESTVNYKEVFFFDKSFGTWRPLPTKDNQKEKFVRSLIHLPYARIAVFEYPKVLTSGQASWYKYKGGNFAASPDFPKGSKVRVINIANEKYVDVEINDFGPDRSLFPNRAIDLDKVAFAKIASPGSGIINVRLEPLQILPELGRILEIDPEGASHLPRQLATSAIIMEEDTGKILYNFNATATLPLASLTKIIAAKVFLDTRPTLSRTIAYTLQDEKYNYQYCKDWESAKIKLKEGDVVTIEDLIYASLVGSTNNTIETLVRASGLDRNQFIALMNQTVASWGASNTKFIEPTGLSPNNISSAYDYALIVREALKNPIIQKASTMAEYVFYTVNDHRKFRVRNTNTIIKTFKYHITGSKTGYLDEAGYCLMTRVEQNGHKLIIVTMGATTRENSFRTTEDLIQYGLKNYD